MRIDWNDLWINFALLVSQRSTDEKYKVGCVIVSKDNTRVLALGYNGDEKGGSNSRESMNSGCSGFIHAEINALIKCDYNYNGDKVMYITHSPCKMCAKAIINGGIKEVFYLNKYSDISGILLLKQNNIFCKQVK